MYNRTLSLAVACFLSSAAVGQEKPLDDSKRVQGTWEWDADKKQSDAMPKIMIEKVIVKDDKLVFHYRFLDQRSTSECELKLDSKSSPKCMDFTPNDGANKGKAYLAIYEVDDGKFKFCYR